MKKLSPKAHILKVPTYVPGRHETGGNIPPAILSANENPLGSSKLAIEGLQNFNKLNRYPDGASTALRHALAEKHDLAPDQLIITAGSDELISLICRCYCGVGDNVVMTQYGFLMVEISTKLCGAEILKAQETDYRADMDAILETINGQTKIVFLANPNNPTGSYVSAKDVAYLRDKMPADILLVLDGAYAEYMEADDYSPGIDLIQKYDNVIMTRTFSKIYGLAALRLGWGYAADSIIATLHRARSPFNVSAAASIAGVEALKDVGFIEDSLALNRNERARIFDAITNMGHNKNHGWKVYPSHTNFIMMACKDADAAANLFQYLLDQGIIVRPLAGYDLAQFLRLTIGTIEENDRLLMALQNYG